MTELDSAIRRAIDRAGADDEAARERLYHSARLAFEKGIANHPDLDNAAVEEQRQRFEAVVRRIEAEKSGVEPESDDHAPIQPAVSPDAVRETSAAMPPEPDAPGIVSVYPDSRDDDVDGSVPFPDMAVERSGADDTGSAGKNAPTVDLREDNSTSEHVDFPVHDTSDQPDGPVAPAAPVPRKEDGGDKDAKAARRAETAEIKPKARRKRSGARLFSAVFLIVSLIVFAALGLWLLNLTGLVDQPVSAGGTSSFTKFDAARNGGTPDLVTGNGFGGAWTPIFVPGDSNALVPGPAAEIRKVGSERGDAFRLTSHSSGSDGDIRIAVPAAVLKQMAGTSATIALNMRGVEGKVSRIAIECAFDTMGGCRRRRFAVNPEMTDVVFRVDEQKAAAPGKPGHLLINTNLDGRGRAVDLFAIGLRKDGRQGQ